MSLQSREDLIVSLRSKKFREAFVSSRVSNTLALQIRAMRQEREWSQAHLAELLGTSQNAVYRLESPQYGKPSITTLKRLAAIFDVGLAVWFAPFSKLVDRATNLTTEDILVPSFDEELEVEEVAANLKAKSTPNAGYKEATEEIPVSLREKVIGKPLGFDKPPPRDQREAIAEFLKNMNIGSQLRSNVTHMSQYKETPHASVGSLAR